MTQYLIQQADVKYLNQHCALCFNKPVRYVKTKGGFYKVCDSCRKVLETAFLIIESDVVHAAGEPKKAALDGETKERE